MCNHRRTFRQLLRQSGMALALAAAPWSVPHAAEVGIAAAVNPDAQGTSPGGSVRTLVVADPIAFEETIETGATGQTQLLFLDQSTLTVAPNSQVLIDAFVFDPASGEGTLEMLVTDGLVRYVGGQISKEGGVTINTTTASLGIRGGMALVDARGGRTLAVNLFGRLTVTTKEGRILRADDAGDYVAIGVDGEVDIGRVTAAQLGELSAGFEGGGGGLVTRTIVAEQMRANPGAVPSRDVKVSPPQVALQILAPPDPQETLAIIDAIAERAVMQGQQQAQVFFLRRRLGPPGPFPPHPGPLP